MTWERVLGALSLFVAARAAASIYFFVFWKWFDAFRARGRLALAMMVGTFALTCAAGGFLRHALLAPRLPMPAAAQALGWMLVAAALVLGANADRQIGRSVRYFQPFFERAGRIELRTGGAYGIVRHPIYASWILFQLGVFAIGGYEVVAVAAAILAAGASWFTRQEEQRLVALLDDPAAYARYRQRVPALWPRFSLRRTRSA